MRCRARARPPVHSVDPYSYLVRVPAGGLSGKVLLKQKGTLIAQFGVVFSITFGGIFYYIIFAIF